MEGTNTTLPRKASKRLKILVPVPETDTGGQDEKSKADRLTLVKELCKMTP